MNTQSNAAQSNDSGTPAAAETKSPAQEAQDRFAKLPTIKLNEAEVLDLSGEQVSNPRKYTKVSEAAIANRMPTQIGWKYSAAMFVPGSVTKEFRAGSVFGTIADIVRRSGKAGIPSYELATQLRTAQIGNKRSHYCTELPPVGWAEGYINSAVQQSLIGVHATKKAPALTAPAPAPAADGAAKGDGTNG